jgi:hypothetical protein
MPRKLLRDDQWKRGGTYHAMVHKYGNLLPEEDAMQEQGLIQYRRTGNYQVLDDALDRVRHSVM